MLFPLNEGSLPSNRQISAPSLAIKKFGGGRYIHIPENQKDLEIQAKAVDYVISKTNYSGLSVPGDALSKLNNGKASYYRFFGYHETPETIGINNPSPPEDINKNSNPAWTSDIYPNQGKVTLNLSEFFISVENIQNLWIHEFVGHFVFGWNDDNNSHYKVYDLQINNALFSKCTLELQQIIKSNRQDYYNCEVNHIIDTCKRLKHPIIK